MGERGAVLGGAVAQRGQLRLDVAEPHRRESDHGGRADIRLGIAEGIDQLRSTEPGAARGGQGGGANLRIAMRGQHAEDPGHVGAQITLEQGQGVTDHAIVRVIEHERGDALASLGEQIERRQCFAFVRTGQGLDEQRDRRSIEHRQSRFAMDPGRVERVAEVADVRPAGHGDHRQPERDAHGRDDRERPGRAGVIRDREHDAGGECLSASLAEDLDERLRALALRARHRHEQDLADHAMDAVAESSIGELEDEHGERRPGEHEPERRDQDEHGQHAERGAHAHAIEQARSDAELDHEREDVEARVRRSEHGRELISRERLHEDPLEHKIADRERHRRHHGEQDEELRVATPACEARSRFGLDLRCGRVHGGRRR